MPHCVSRRIVENFVENKGGQRERGQSPKRKIKMLMCPLMYATLQIEKHKRRQEAQQMDKETLRAQRGQMIVKANEIIQRSRFQLSTSEQKIILYLISKINPIMDADFNEYEFSITEFARICGVEIGGRTYELVKNEIQSLADKSMWLQMENGTETLVRWIAKARIDRTGYIQIKLDDDLKPYLLQLTSGFTKFQLLFAIRLKSKYSIRLFELAHSIHYDKSKPYTRRYELEEFKQLLGAENYIEYKDFKKRVLKPAVEEINKYSDINIEINKIVSGHRIIAVELVVSSKSDIELAFLRDEINEELGSPQVSIWELIEKQEAAGSVINDDK